MSTGRCSDILSTLGVLKMWCELMNNFNPGCTARSEIFMDRPRLVSECSNRLPDCSQPHTVVFLFRNCEGHAHAVKCVLVEETAQIRPIRFARSEEMGDTSPCTRSDVLFFDNG